MKKNIFTACVMTVAALSGTVLIFDVRHAGASPFNPIIVADAGTAMDGMDMKGMKMEKMPASHNGTGTVKNIDAAKGTVTLSHGPIPSLNWPAMTMSFKLKDAALANGIKAGDIVDFALVQSGSDYLVTRLHPSGK